MYEVNISHNFVFGLDSRAREHAEWIFIIVIASTRGGGIFHIII